jgi:FkbM family methyltransferase
MKLVEKLLKELDWSCVVSKEKFDMSYVTEGAAEYCRTLFPADFKGIGVDVGAYHATWISNTWIFEQEGWEIYCIEPNPHCIVGLNQSRNKVVQCAIGSEYADNKDFFVVRLGHGPDRMAGGTGLLDAYPDNPEREVVKVNVRTFDWLVEKILKIDHVDYLSIDVEGTEMDVLKFADLDRWGVKVIVIENIGEDVAQHEYLVSKGFEKLNRIYVNDIYRRVGWKG